LGAAKFPFTKIENIFKPLLMMELAGNRAARGPGFSWVGEDDGGRGGGFWAIYPKLTPNSFVFEQFWVNYPKSQGIP
jgi:hypothetical protein